MKKLERIENQQNENSMEEVQKKGMSAVDWIWVILCIIYAVSPVDIVPDAIPVAGWVDDILILLPGILNAFQQNLEGAHEYLAKIFKVLKWILIIAGAIVIILLFIIVVLLAKAFGA